MFNRFVHREFDNPQPNSADDMQRALRRHQATQPLTDNDYDDEVSSSYSPPSGVLPHGYGRGRPQQRLPIGFANPSAAPPMPSWSRTTTRYGPPPPTEYLLPGSPGAEVGGELSSPAPASGSSIPPLRPSLGRSVAIGPNHGIDLARGLVILKSSLAQNQIRISALRQRFHERPGLKRKRLKSERYRARFLKGFRRMVSQVQHMRRQGW
ncbi:MAG: hypothetical protein M1826_006042 [Phylliscum demangeonii]|nr:MAG: hypothetical protein M1826_006042 [Phylliscum demangeonii]